MATMVFESGPPESVLAAMPHKKFTPAEVDRMLELGLFEGQRFELIEGDLIDKMGQNPPPRICPYVVPGLAGDDLRRPEGSLPVIHRSCRR